MNVFVSPSGNREIWKQKPEGYFTEDEWKALHPDRVYSIAGTPSFRIVPWPYDGLMENEIDMSGLPPDDISVSAAGGNWVESSELAGLKLAELKAVRLDELNTAFEVASENAHCTSSAGFEINADEAANRNVSSLIIAMEATGEETVRFCAYDNTFHDVTLAQLKAMQLEIIANAQAIYARKWALRERIHAAETVGALMAVETGFDEGGE